jgi:DNA-directed RNA polymerase specialized sigma24 family protein
MTSVHLEAHAARLTAARAGDRAAFDLLIADLTPLVWHVARAGGLHTADAEDVVQTVWLTLRRDLDTVTDPAALAAWLITTTRAAASDRQSAPEEPATTDDGDRGLLVAFRAVPAHTQESLRLSALLGQAADPDHLAELRARYQG